MATFRVGQRVKRIHKCASGCWDITRDPPAKIGEEGIIVFHDGRTMRGGERREYRVKWDSFGHVTQCHSWQLEPISDSNTKISWSDMADLWTPAHLGEVECRLK